LPHAITRDASANGIKIGGELMHFTSDADFVLDVAQQINHAKSG
jgi:hypothetical protein